MYRPTDSSAHRRTYARARARQAIGCARQFQRLFLLLQFLFDLLSSFLDRRPTRITQAENAGNFIKGFACGIIACASKQLVLTVTQITTTVTEVKTTVTQITQGQGERQALPARSRASEHPKVVDAGASVRSAGECNGGGLEISTGARQRRC